MNFTPKQERATRRRLPRFTRRGIIIVAAISVGACLLGGAAYAALGGAPKASSSSDIELQKGLIGYWPLNGNTKDSTPFGDNGTLAGSPLPTLTTDRKGAASSAYAFSGNQQITVSGFGTRVVGMSAMTISGWVKPSNNPTNYNHYFGLRNDANADFYVLQLQNTNTLECRFRGSGGTSYTTPSVPVTPNVWQLVTLTYDGSTLKCSVNTGTQYSIAASGTITNTLIDLTMGGAYNNYMTGSLDDVRFYSRALNTAEIAALYNQYNPGLRTDAGENGLVGWWKMDGNAKDASPYANNGTVSGASLTADRKATANSAYSFPGNNSYIQIPDSASLDSPTTGITISVWINPTNWSGGNRRILQKSTDGSQYMLFDNGGVMTMTLGNIGSVTYGTLPTLSQTTLVTATYDQTSMKLYYNGVQVASAAGTNPIATTTDLLVVGNKPGSGTAGDSFYGTMDDLRIYSRALSATEITAMYKSYNPSIQVSNLQSGLVGDWPFNGNAKDATPYGSNGTVTGATLTADRKGRANSAYSLNGTSNYISVPDSTPLDVTNGVTVSAWVYATNPSSGNIQGIICKDVSGSITNCPYALQLGTTGIPSFFTTNSSNTNASISFNTTVLSANVWHQIVGTYYNGGSIFIYVDGVRSTGGGGQSGTIGVTTGALNFGQQKAGVSRFFSGSIDDVRVWNRALSSNEITTLYSEYR